MDRRNRKRQGHWTDGLDKQFIGMPHDDGGRNQFPAAGDLLKAAGLGAAFDRLRAEDEFPYSTTFGDLYDIVVEDDGTLTVKLKDAL